MADDIKKLGRYELGTVLGKGAMGVVYEGWDPRLTRKVAIKTIIKSRLEEESARSYSARFMREAAALAQLNHPNIVQVYDFGEENDVAYIVMEFVEDGDLKERIDGTEKFAVKDAIRIVSELLDALDFAHQKGVIHRDIKPANVMFDVHGRVKLADFGVARIENADATNSEKTQVGTQIGTPLYMSPEQVRMEKLDRRSDIFSAGVILYQLLTGERPFYGDSIWSIQKKIVSDNPNPPSLIRAEISPEYDQVINKALAKEREERYNTGHEFKEALQRAFEASPPPDYDATVLNVPTPPAASTENVPTNPLRARAAVTTQSQELELEYWRSIKDSDDPEDYESYIEQFPHGTYASLAQRKASKLRRGTTRSEDSGPRTVPLAGQGVRSGDTVGPGQAESARSRMEADVEAHRIREIAEREAEVRAEQERAKEAAAALARKEAEQRLLRQAEEEARREAEERARLAAEKKQREAIERAARELEEQQRLEAAKAEWEAREREQREAEERTRKLAEEQALRQRAERERKEAEERARLAAQALAREQAAQEQARREREEQAQRETEARAQREADERAQREAEKRARDEEAAARARKEAEERNRRQAEEDARRKAEERAREEAERTRLEAEAREREEQAAQARKQTEAAAKLRLKLEEEERARREVESRQRSTAEQQTTTQRAKQAQLDAASEPVPVRKVGQRTGVAVGAGIFALATIGAGVAYFMGSPTVPVPPVAVNAGPDTAAPSTAVQQEAAKPVAPQPDADRQALAEDNARREAAEKAKAEIARLEAEKKLTAAAAAKAKAETDRKLAEQQAKADSERAAVAAKAREEAERVGAAARAKEEAERLAAAARAKDEADRTAAAARAREDADRTAAAAKAKEAERVAAAARAKEAERLASLKVEEEKKTQAARGEALFKQANALLKEGKSDEAMKMLAQAGAAGHAGAKSQLDAMVQEIVKRAELVDQARQRR